MNKYWLLRLQLVTFCLGIVTIVDANAETATTPEETTESIAPIGAEPLGTGRQTQLSAEDRASLELAEAARQKVIAEAGILLKNGKPADAYALMLPYQPDYAGDVDFDYLLGIAALDSGKPTEAIFALERVLAVKPDHLQARAEIARAFVATGETVAARQEFETVKQQNPPPAVAATIQKYLDIIETKRSEDATSLRGYIEAGYGHDSNVNSATASNQFFIGPLPFTISDAGSLANEDEFSSAAAGFSIRHSVSPDWAIVGGANYNQRFNSTWDTFDTASLDGSLGFNFSNGGSNYSAVLQAQRFEVDNETYRDAQGVTAQWQGNLQGGNLASVYLQYTELTYPEQTFRDAYRSVLGGAYAFALGGQNSSVIYMSAYGGMEKEKDKQPENAQYGHDLYGLRIGSDTRLSEKITLMASAGFESRAYGGPDSLFSYDRKDEQGDARLAIGYQLGQKWTVTPSLNYILNSSNIVIYDYKRTMFSVSLRRDFN